MTTALKSLLFFILFLLALQGCGGDKDKMIKPVDIDLEQIRQRGKLVAMTGYSATSYFIYKGQPMGYEYELLTRLADELDIELEIIIENDLKRLITRLNAGEGDIVAHDITITKPRRELVDFTQALLTTRQVLVQRKPENWRRMKLHDINSQLIRDPIELEGKTIHVKAASSYVERLENLSEEIGYEINIVEVGGDTTTEQLIQEVADGKIELTVSDQHIAQINQAYYSNLDIKTPISLTQQVAWAVRKTSPELLSAINSWLEKMKNGTAFYVIRNKYFKNRSAFARRVKSEYLSVTGGKISQYDDLLRTEAEKIGWDWRLLASLIYQESKFNVNARSWMGAVGLMQLLPATAREFGASNPRNPEANIEAGVQYLRWLDEYWTEHVPDQTERVKFILGSYNVGIGHVQDARRLAEKYGRDPALWEDNVAYYLLRLSEPKYYRDEVVEFGYCRGIEPFNYVNEIFARYDHYQKFINT
ncbi:MAG: transporter substrate-binding domain-containing protein [Calditrichia bacterium]